MLNYLKYLYCYFAYSERCTLGSFKSFVMDNKASRNLFCNPQKSFHTSPTQTIEAVNHSSNSTIAFTKCFTSSRIFFLVNAIVEFEEWLTASIIRVRRFWRGVKILLWITEKITKRFVIKRGKSRKI